MKRLSRIALVLLMLTAALFAFAACSGGVDEIYIDRGDDPQTTFVQGNDPDFSKGQLTVKNGKKTEKIPLNSEGIAVIGYDKDTLGDQAIHFEYKGKKTENALTVTVVPRMRAVTDINYFVGETFNQASGQIALAYDDGRIARINISDPALSSEDLDTSKTGTTQTITVRYKTEQYDYTGKIDVGVYEVEGIALHTPRTNYKSHESQVDVTGGYLTLTANGGKVTRNVELTEDMITGFDPSLATEEDNMTTKNGVSQAGKKALAQELTVEYYGLKKTYTIYISFSEASLLWSRAAEFDALYDWENGIPKVSDAIGKRALEAVNDYLTLYRRAQQNGADGEEAFATWLYVGDSHVTVARVAAAYGGQCWDTAMTSLLEAAGRLEEVEKGNYDIAIANSTLMPKFRTPELAEKYVELLSSDEHKDLFEAADMLKDIKNEYDGFPFYRGITFGVYFGYTCDSAQLNTVVRVMPYLVNAHNALKEMDNLPTEDWTYQDHLTAAGRGEHIDAAYDELVKLRLDTVWDDASTLNNLLMRPYFAVIELWREEAHLTGDFFEILYAYYYGIFVSQAGSNEEATKLGEKFAKLENENTLKEESEKIAFRAFTKINKLQTYTLPGILEELYENAIYAQYQTAYMDMGYVFDTTMFMNYYRKVYELSVIAEDVDKTPERVREIYFYFGLNTMLLQINTYATETSTQAYGYIPAMDSYLGDEIFKQFWNDYLEVMDVWIAGGNATTDPAFAKQIEDLFDTFTTLSPTRQFGFLLSLNVTYADAIIYPEDGIYALDFDQGISNYFLLLFANHYNAVLTPEAYEIFHDLLCAVEDYARLELDDEEGTFHAAFFEEMEALQANYAALTGEGKATFDNLLGSFYQNYVKIYENVKAGGHAEKSFGEWQDEIDKVKDALQAVQFAMASIQEIGPWATLSAFEYADHIVNEFLANAPEDLIWEFYYGNCALYGDEAPSYSLDFWMYDARTAYISMINQIPLTTDESGRPTSALIDFYFTSFAGLTDFLSDIYSGLFHFYRGAAYEKDALYRSMYEYLDLNPAVAVIINDYTYGAYLSALQDFFESSASGLQGKAKDVAQLLAAVQYDFGYFDGGVDTFKGVMAVGGGLVMEDLRNTYNAMKKLYDDMSENAAEKKSFEPLEELYATYVEKYNNAIR